MSRLLSSLCACVFGIGLCIGASSTAADVVATYDVGAGDSIAEVQFDFLNGNTYVYSLRWDGTLYGRDIFDVIAAAQPNLFVFEYETYSFGDFLTGVSIGEDSDSGFGTPPDYIDYWHYWTHDGSGVHEASMIGFNDRVLVDGSADAWVFGHNDAPASIPAPGALLVLLMGSRVRRQRRG